MSSAPKPSRHPREETIFLEAASIADGQLRAAWLESACGGDPELLARVRDLLLADACNRAAPIAAPAVEFGSEQMPVRIGAYEVSRMIGEGAMGTVYEARQTATGRRCAVKVLRAGLATPAGRQRFQREAQFLAKLNHPGIAQVYDAGIAAAEYSDASRGQRCYLAMEFVAGWDAAGYVREKQPDAGECVALLEQAAIAVNYAHTAGVIHRDLKPSNILVGEEGTVKIVDFGIARIADQGDEEQQTHTGIAMGTPGYMSPEQRRGLRDRIDTRTDVYALGATLYALVTRSAPPAPAGGDDPASLPNGPNTDEKLTAILRKAMHPQPEQRYASALEFAEDLGSWRRREPILAKPEALDGFWRWYRKHRVKAIALAAAIVVWAILAPLATWQAIQARRAQAEADAALRFLSDTLSAASPETKAGGRDTRMVDVLNGSLQSLDKWTGDPLARSAVEMAMGSAYHELSEHATGRKLLARAYETRNRMLGGNDERTQAAAHELALVEYEMGDLKQAEQRLQSVCAWRAGHYGPDHKETLSCRGNLAAALGALGRREEGYQTQKDVVERLGRKYGTADETWMRYASLLAALESGYKGNLPEAIRLSEAVLAAQLRTLGPKHAHTIMTQAILASQYVNNKQTGKAIPLLEAALKIAPDTLGPDHADTLRVQMTLGLAYRETGRLDQALRLLSGVATKCERIMGAEDPRTLTTRAHMARALELAGRTNEAEVELRKVVALERASPAHRLKRLLGHDLMTLGRLRVKAGHPEQALPLYEEGVAVARQTMDEKSANFGEHLRTYALALERAGQRDKARPLAAEAARILDPATPKPSLAPTRPSN